MPHRLSRGAVVAAVTPLLLLAACGDDDGAGVGDVGSASGSGSGSASGSAAGSASASAAAAADCSPVGADLEAGATETVEVVLDDYAFVPSDVTVAAGTVTFAAVNRGTEPHELAFLPGGGEVAFTDGAPDEAALEEAGAFELEAFGPDQTCNATYELDPGAYTLFCIVEADDGETHYEKGMRGTLTVE